MTEARLLRPLAAAALALLLTFGLAAQAGATEIVLVNLDGANEGLNDPTFRAPVPGNPGDSLGEQRRNAVLYAANLLASRVVSSVPIVIEVDFRSLDCDAGGAGLAFGGPSNLFIDFPGQPHANVLYPAALADAISDQDLFGADDAGVTFTSALDDGAGGRSNCLGRADWYYGTDHNPVGNDLNFVSTAVHELIHGLGFVSIANLNMADTFPDGAFEDGIRGEDFPDIFSFFILDIFFGERWRDLTAGERVDSADDGGDDSVLSQGGEEVVWSGDVTSDSGADSIGDAGKTQGFVRLYAPSPIETGSSISHWAIEVTPDALMEPVAPSNEDVDVREGIGLGSCVLRDIGWQLAAAVPCPDDSGQPTSGSRARFVNAPPIDSIPGGDGGGGDGIVGDGDGGGGCTLAGGPFDPVWLLLLLTGAWRVARRRR